MKKESHKNKITIDTKNYVTPGTGVSTTDLINDPSANDLAWATVEAEKSATLVSQVAPIKLLINLIGRFAAFSHKKIEDQVEIENVFLPILIKFDIFNEVEILKDPIGLKKYMNRSAKKIFISIQEKKPDFFNVIIRNEEFVVEVLKTVFSEKLITLKNVTIPNDKIHTLAVYFMAAFKASAKKK